MNDGDFLNQLMATILERKQNPDAKSSWTAKLLAGGVEKISGKISEEAAEVVEAAGEPGDAGHEHLIYEAGDLVYHLMVLLAARDAQWSEVVAELQRREGTSGISEKESRSE